MYTPKREPLGKDPRKRQGVERMINLRKSFDGTGTAKKVQGKSTQRVMQKGRVQIYWKYGLFFTMMDFGSLLFPKWPKWRRTQPFIISPKRLHWREKRGWPWQLLELETKDMESHPAVDPQFDGLVKIFLGKSIHRKPYVFYILFTIIYTGVLPSNIGLGVLPSNIGLGVLPSNIGVLPSNIGVLPSNIDKKHPSNICLNFPIIFLGAFQHRSFPVSSFSHPAGWLDCSPKRHSHDQERWWSSRGSSTNAWHKNISVTIPMTDPNGAAILMVNIPPLC